MTRFVQLAAVALANLPFATFAADPPAILTSGCRGAIAAEMGRDPRTMSVTPRDDLMQLSYRRPDDRTLWRVVCRLGASDALNGGSVIEWASLRDDGSVGRWRNDYRYDNKIVVTQDGRMLVVTRTYPNGSTSTERMTLASVNGAGRSR